MKKAQTTIIFFVLINLISSFTITSHHDDHLPVIFRNRIMNALALDSFFGGMEETKVLGSGTYGYVLKMKKPAGQGGKEYAVKIGTEDLLNEASFPLTEDMLNVERYKLNTIIRGNRVIEFLKTKNVPYITNLETFRYVVFSDYDKNSIVYVVSAMELADQGDMYGFAEKIKNGSQDRKYKIFKDLFLKMALSLYRVNKQKFVHGDIKIENTFVRSCNDFGGVYCPVVGDWDLVYNYETTPTSGSLRYTLYNRPPEMIYFTKMGDTGILVGPTGYKYSGKEDVYALAANMMEFANFANISLEQDMVNLLTDMVHPLTFEQLKQNTWNPDDDEKQASCVRNGKAMNYHLSTTFKNLKNELDALSLEVNDKLPVEEDYVDFMQRVQNGQHHTGTSPYYVVDRRIAVGEGRLAHLTELIGQEKAQQFVNLEKKLLNQTPFSKVVINRISMGQVLTSIYQINNPSAVQGEGEELTNAANEGIRSMYATLDSSNTDDSDFDELKSHVSVLPSFYTSALSGQKNVCEFYDALLENSQIIMESAKTVDFNSKKIEQYSVYDFCSQLNIRNIQREKEAEERKKNLEEGYFLALNDFQPNTNKYQRSRTNLNSDNITGLNNVKGGFGDLVQKMNKQQTNLFKVDNPTNDGVVQKAVNFKNTDEQIQETNNMYLAVNQPTEKYQVERRPMGISQQKDNLLDNMKQVEQPLKQSDGFAKLSDLLGAKQNNQLRKSGEFTNKIITTNIKANNPIRTSNNFGKKDGISNLRQKNPLGRSGDFSKNFVQANKQMAFVTKNNFNKDGIANVPKPSEMVKARPVNKKRPSLYSKKNDFKGRTDKNLKELLNQDFSNKYNKNRIANNIIQNDRYAKQVKPSDVVIIGGNIKPAQSNLQRLLEDKPIRSNFLDFLENKANGQNKKTII